MDDIEITLHSHHHSLHHWSRDALITSTIYQPLPPNKSVNSFARRHSLFSLILVHQHRAIKRSMDPAQSLFYLINHVFLPPKLPQKEDSDVVQESALIEECEAALRSFQAHLPSNEHWRWAACTRMLSNMLKMRDASGDMASGKVETSLGSMVNRGISHLKVMVSALT